MAHHHYPDHRLIPPEVPEDRRAEIAAIDERFAQIRETLGPLLDEYSELVVERERLVGYTIPDVTPEEVDVLLARSMEMLRVDPDGYLAPVVRSLLATIDSISYHSARVDSPAYREMEAAWCEKKKAALAPEPEIFRPLPMDYADPRWRPDLGGKARHG